MKSKKFKKINIILLVFSIVFVLSGCSALDSFVSKIKGELIGQKFNINVYDDFANKILNLQGEKVTVGLKENSANSDTESTGYKSDVLEITVNGQQMLQIGNTILFEEQGLNMVEGFEIPEDVTITNGGGFVPLDRFINDIKNLKGTGKTVVISSQTGIPIGVYQGEKVYVEIPEDLPKMTLLNIDGKSLYIHRANYIILDSSMIK